MYNDQPFFQPLFFFSPKNGGEFSQTGGDQEEGGSGESTTDSERGADISPEDSRNTAGKGAGAEREGERGERSEGESCPQSQEEH